VSTSAILVLQGGGALGAYECGAYKALVPHLKEHDQDLKIVAGTSIGALNASIIALNYGKEDYGAGTLESIWKRDLAVTSLAFPYPVPVCEESQRWNAVWTTLLNGHPRLFTPRLPGWQFLPSIFWSHLTHFYDTQAMEQTVERYFKSSSHAAAGGFYGPCAAAPRLIITAVDVDEGRGVAFDSLKQSITPEHVVASGSLPPWFPAKTIEGGWYWDGGLWANTPLRDVLYVLEDEPFLAGEVGTHQKIYIVDVFPRRSPPAGNIWEVLGRINEISYADKTRHYGVGDLMNRYARSAKRALRHIELIPRLYELSKTLPASELKDLIEQEYEEHEKLSSKEKEEYRQIQQNHINLEITRIERSPLHYEAISRDIDFTSERIEALIDQGYEDMKETLTTESERAEALKQFVVP
jgi:predicted acylesterase/phospholipase RssA